MLKTKLLAFFKEVRIIIRENPFVSKSVFAHIGFVLLLVILAKISAMKFSLDSKIQIQVNNTKSAMPQVIEATSITNSDLNKEIKAYEKRQDDIKQAKEDIKRAKQQAIKKAEDARKAKIAAEEKAKQEAIKKAALEAKQKADAEKKAIAKAKAEKEALEKQQRDKAAAAKIIEEKKAEEQKKKEALEKQQKDKADSERRAKEKELADARAEAEAKAREQIEQSRADRAISSYISDYQNRVGDNWIKDSCRGIYDLPRAIIKNGQFIKLTGTSGNFSCDKSLIDAIKNTTPPTVTNSAARQTIETESISFIFTQN